MSERAPASGHSESLALIHNPASGLRDSRDQIDRAATVFQDNGWLVEIYSTEGPRHAIEIAANAARNDDVQSRKITRVIAAGGDGLMREAAKGLVAAKSMIPLGTIPTGTVNVFARETNTPLEPVSAAKILYEGEIKLMDTGRVNEELFLFNAGGLMDAEVFAKLQKPGKKKAKRGFVPYIIPTLTTVPFFEGVAGTLTIGDEEWNDSFTQIWVGNTRGVGHVVLRPEAQADDGLHEFTAYTGRRGIQMVSHFFSGVLLPRGERPGSIYRQGNEMTLELRKPVAVQADGDTLPRSNRIQTKVIPDSLYVWIPKGPNNLFSRV